MVMLVTTNTNSYRASLFEHVVTIYDVGFLAILLEWFSGNFPATFRVCFLHSIALTQGKNLVNKNKEKRREKYFSARGPTKTFRECIADHVITITNIDTNSNSYKKKHIGNAEHQTRFIPFVSLLGVKSVAISSSSIFSLNFIRYKFELSGRNGTTG